MSADAPRPDDGGFPERGGQGSLGQQLPGAVLEICTLFANTLVSSLRFCCCNVDVYLFFFFYFFVVFSACFRFVYSLFTCATSVSIKAFICLIVVPKMHIWQTFLIFCLYIKLFIKHPHHCEKNDVNIKSLLFLLIFSSCL